MPLSTGQVLNKRYRIVNLLGQGGFGAVYRAWDMNLDTPVALKENLNTSPASIRQFKTEALLLANLRHPNLPYVIDHFSVDDQGQYLVMEFVEGKDLQETLNEKRKALPVEDVMPWIEQVCDALIYLHTKSPPIIHRDIKPANIKITPQGQARLVDFGVAKQYNPSRQTTVGARAVTLGYSPPEQYGQGITDARSDVYALGATSYALLTGQIPPESLQLRLGKILTPPSQINPEVSPGTESAILRSMNMVPDKRFQSVEKFKAALDPLPGSDPVVQRSSHDEHAKYDATVVAGSAAAAGAALAGTVPAPKPVPRHSPKPAPSPAPTPRAAPPPAYQPGPAPAAPPPTQSRNWTGLVVGIFLALCLIVGVGSVLGYYLLVPPAEDSTHTPVSIALDKTNTAISVLLSQTSPPTSIPASATWTAAAPTSPPPTELAATTQAAPPSPTPVPTRTATSEFELWQPCAGSYPSRLRVGDKAYISYDPPLPNRVRTDPNTSGEVVGYLQVGEKMTILDGPVCAQCWIWWRVRFLDTGITGWTAEGDFENYWLVPLN